MKSRYRFVGTPLPLTENEAYHLHKYWKKGRRDGTIRAWKGFDIDSKALLTPVLLDCRNCHHAHHESCCEGGFPFPPAHEQTELLELHLPELTKRHLHRDKQEQLQQQGLYERHQETTGLPTIATFKNDCLFCEVEGAGPACAAHRYALEEQLLPEQVKPFSCALFPLEWIVEEGGRLLITALNEETARFSRWGSAYRHDFVCANLPLRLRASDKGAPKVSENIRAGLLADAFAPDRYRPVYQEMKEILCRTYGDELWQEIEASYQPT
ncbi:hypothetical protein CIG75_16100 [Tumebacillus algifaecis]|uniref:DUF3109 domain-containing protein n=1 Tax=Tumebacillus algifaecis TaxID=1214604 RepID=A0A223D3W8_9BACL|nr:DUF3109 family protein [Tumebacillus algifaecis]ASS76318.1 hypothetical protein CIG75_16100 [Tumebacillus algifaecis]